MKAYVLTNDGRLLDARTVAREPALFSEEEVAYAAYLLKKGGRSKPKAARRQRQQADYSE